MTARILCVGDVHLGRRPSRLPEVLRGFGVSAEELGPLAAWRALVRWAVAERPDAVVLAGDVVESDNARFEAWGALRAGVADLQEAGVPVIAVAGNHDVEALPRLARVIDGFRLLGGGGRWETCDVRRDGRTVARVLGWSFPQRVVERSPLEDLQLRNDHSVPVLGVLHCDLDATERRYAPVRRLELEATPVAGWVLGHVHQPSLDGSTRPIGYLGSLVGLDPSEVGPRGPWEVELDADGAVRARHQLLAPLRWESLDVSLDELRDPDEELQARVAAALEQLHADLGDALVHTRAVGCQLRFTGRVWPDRRLKAAIAGLAQEPIAAPIDGVVYFTTGALDLTRPAYDLEVLARGSDPVAWLARDLLALQAGGDEAAELLAATGNRLGDVARAPQFRGVGAWEPEGEGIRALLLRAGWDALHDLLAQKEVDA